MSLYLLTFLIGAFNLFVGYAVAVRLGYGPPTLTAPLFARLERGDSQPGIGDDDFESMLNDMMETSTDDMFDQSDETEMDLQPIEEPYDDEALVMAAGDAPEIWDLNEKYVETSILRLNIAMMKSGARCTEIDTLLRSIRRTPDRQTIEDCWNQLKEDCESYLSELNEAAERFAARIGELGDLAGLGEEIEFANMNLASQIETTVSNLTHMDHEKDLELAGKRLVEELANLRAARHRLRDDQEAAFLTIARCENRMDKIEEKLYHDALTGIRNRVGLEVALHEWWGQRRHESRSINAILFDLDGFNLCNDEHGCLAGDRILCHVAQTIVAEMGSSDLVARFSGQRFLLLAVDCGPRAAIKTAETIRQKIEKISFARGESRFGVTVSGTITEVTSQDASYLEVFERLEKCVVAAKQHGRNCTFGANIDEFDDDPQLIEAPSFGIDEQEIDV